MNTKRYSWTEPVLCHYSYDLSKEWFITYTFFDHLTGRKKRPQIRNGINYKRTVAQRKEVAKETILATKNALRHGFNPFLREEVAKMPFHYSVVEAFDTVLKIKLPTLKERAREHYSYVVKLFKEWLEQNGHGGILMMDFPKSLAIKYMDHLTLQKHYAGRTYNDHLRILKTLINRMIDRDWIAKSPFKGIPNQAVTIGRNIAFSDEERQRLQTFLYTHDRDMYYLTQIMYYCFIRRSELSKLKIADFDLKNHTITVPADVSKNKCQESVVIPLGLDGILEEMNLSQYDPSYYIFGRRLQRSPELFKGLFNISTRHNRHLKTLKIDRQKGLYSHKHTGVVKAYYSTGKDVYSVMRQLRHRDLNTTQIYLKSLGLVQNDVFRNSMTA